MTFHLHIKGRVQGVGFRPQVYKCALKKNVYGYISNEADGVHVVFNQASQKDAKEFAEKIIQQAPSKAIIQNYSLKEIDEETFDKFSIRIHESNTQPDLLISPDFAMCPQCKNEFHDKSNRRYQYPFITCTLCGPRYSIMQQLPYERHLTAMHDFIQCEACNKEYNNVNDRRYFSQTNSCSVCGIKLFWHIKESDEIIYDEKQILSSFIKALEDEKIIAVKGIGGFLLMCNAQNKNAIQILRERKYRPRKPFAVLFPNAKMVQEYTYANHFAIDALTNEVSPIVLLQAKGKCFQELDMKSIAPGLTSIGIMLPYAPLLEWIISTYQKPLIATSGNLSGSCIVFQSEKKEELFQYADFILDHNRGIVIPQDDSVIRFAEKSNQQIILRRSRGLAPAIILPSTIKNVETIFAAGAMLKSAFAIQHNNQIYLSQYLGNLESYDAQQNYQHTFHHFQNLLKIEPLLGADTNRNDAQWAVSPPPTIGEIKPEVVLTDLHPDYPSTQLAIEHAKQWDAPVKKIQHHEAHFTAILGEHYLFKCNEKILGVIWDGTGLGSDGNIWGGEFFVNENGKMERVHWLEPFPNFAGDKMAKEPRLAAFAISNDIEEAGSILKSKFIEQEWNYYQKAIQQESLQNTSAGRYFDGVSSLLNFVNINSYEGEAALVLEQQAYSYLSKNNFEIDAHYFDEEINQPEIPMKNIIRNIINDINSGKNKQEIAALFHTTLVTIILKIAYKLGIKKLAFSGGVFQNAVLIDLVYLQLEKSFELYFHKQMPPNDECIAFGQLQHYQNIKI